jgi:hypothetical protein
VVGDQIRCGRRAFGLLAPLALAAAPASAATGSGETHAVVIEPLSLVNTGPLLFGDISAGPAPGTVVVNQNTGARTVTGGVTALGGTPRAASFTGAAAGLNLVVIRIPTAAVTLNRVGGGGTLQITTFTLQGNQFRLFFTRQAFTFNVGGTLAVGANQPHGTYVGTFPVTVDYF